MTLTISQQSQLSPEAKGRLAEVVRKLRADLIKDLGHALESTYRLSIPLERAELAEEAARRRQRLEAWLDEQARGGTRGVQETAAQARLRHQESLVKLAAATLLNRLVVQRQMEALGLVRVRVLTGGWESRGYQEFRSFGQGLLGDESEGYFTLLRLVWDELALDLPGLFGTLGPTTLVPIPSATLRQAVEALEDPRLEGAWTDDTTLGWVYQFWNDPDREALDEKIRNRGKIENHEIAAKTQLFTDRYMVEWMLQNSLGQLWFSICSRNGWTPEVVASGTLDRLEARRAEWRAKRDAGEVDLEALMPLESDEEERWKYWVPRELPEDAAEHAPSSLKEMKLLDPACGSGHFLVIAFELLVGIYKEEARHRGVAWSDEEIAGWILENNLHGIDLDPRAVQIAAAALWLKARTFCRTVAPGHLNLVASNLGLGSLPKDDPALLELEHKVEEETGIPAHLTRTIVEALKGADYLGSLLKVERAVESAIDGWERLQDLFSMPRDSRVVTHQTIVNRLEDFLDHHTSAEELGLRLRGEQLAAGVRFVRMIRDDYYHVIAGNPPYQNSRKMASPSVFAHQYPDGQADLSVAFALRSLQLLKLDGICCLLAVRGSLFIGQFETFRRKLLTETTLEVLGDFDWGAFSEVVGKTLCVTAALARKRAPNGSRATAIQPFPIDTPYRNDNRRSYRKAAATMVQVGRLTFHPSDFTIIDGWPLVYWWKEDFLTTYANARKLGQTTPARATEGLYNNARFTRNWWEVRDCQPVPLTLTMMKPRAVPPTDWVPFTNGNQGAKWFEPLRTVAYWRHNGLHPKLYKGFRVGSEAFRFANEQYFFSWGGVAFAMIGSGFSARLHRFTGSFGDMGRSIFSDNPGSVVCLLNSRQAQGVMESLNPGVHFQVGDVNRLPLFTIESANEVVARLDEAFTKHEAHREASVEFKQPGRNCWAYAQEWAQRAVDRPSGERLPPWEPVYVPEPPIDHLSYALGITMGRFSPSGKGVLDTAPHSSIPCGILFLSSSDTIPDSIDHPAARPLHDAWQTHGNSIAPKSTLRDHLRLKFFPDDHLKRYEKRPIYFPLSSDKKSFVAWISIHRWQGDTLQILLADHLNPALARLSAELADLSEARLSGDRKDQVKAQARLTELQVLHDELRAFIAAVLEIAERGAPPSGKFSKRDADARFKMDLDDGVLINAAALWPLLKPQWKDPEKWWVELGEIKGKKDYDWSHLAARYFPKRVDEKCQGDPSLAVAHGCFWKYHPEKAYQWELRLQAPDELGSDFHLDEPGSEVYRADFERQHPDKVQELRAAEERRRQRKAEKAGEDEPSQDELSLFDAGEDDEE